MLSSLAKYIFGGAVGSNTEEVEPMQYHTREVNDWLLVDMPDQPIDNEDMESDEEDDVLSSLPLLLKQDASTCDTPIATVEIVPETEQNSAMDTQVATQSALLNECLEDFQILPESLYLNQLFYYPSDFSLVISQSCKSFLCTTARNPQKFYYMPDTRREKKSKSKTVIVKVSPPPVLADKRVNHPAEISKPFINHRSPIMSPKKVLVEQVKEMKAMQRAIEYDTKKRLVRSQLNRHNRTYIYESSVKTNRRRNLQRNHSGANNNRKC